MREILIRNEEDTKKFGYKLAEELQPGDVLALAGDLGTGKTTLTKYIAEGLGIEEMITSPTFTIVQEYHQGRMPLYHFDVYRITDIEEMSEMGYEEYFFGNGVSIVEWADIIEEIIPEEAKIIFISYTENIGERIYRTNW